MFYILKQRKQLFLNNRQEPWHKVLIISHYLYNIPALIDNEIRLHEGVHLGNQVDLLLNPHNNNLDDHCYHLFPLGKGNDVMGIDSHHAEDDIEIARVFNVLGLT